MGKVDTHVFVICFLGNIHFLTTGCSESYHLRQRTILAVVQMLNQDWSTAACICPHLLAGTVICSFIARNWSHFGAHLWFWRVKELYHCYKTKFHQGLKTAIHSVKADCSEGEMQEVVIAALSYYVSLLNTPSAKTEWYTGSK